MLQSMHSMFAILIATVMGFAAPAWSHDFNQSFTAQKQYEEMRITWHVVDNVPQACATAFYNKPFREDVVACAVRSGIVCDVYTAKKLDLAILGHEIRHCFDGNWHD